jgi:hypothetical protein
MKYLGLISKFDAAVLEKYGKWAGKTLEFGMGGSTMIFAQCGTQLYSLETDPYWIDRTRSNLVDLGADFSKIRLMGYNPGLPGCDGQLFDLVFVDGTAEDRFPFALAAFQRLKLGGWILFHDTRCKEDLRNMLDMMLVYQNEIGEVKMNMDHSNISGCTRKAPEPQYDWSKAEGRTRWMDGLEPPPEGWVNLLS